MSPIVFLSFRSLIQITRSHSALTDYLASHNISAVQIRDDYERRRSAADAQARANGEGPAEDEQPEVPESETEVQTKKRKRKAEKEIAKIKKSKEYQRRRKAVAGEPGADESDDDLVFDMYTKKKPLPGQLENCEICEKRFTVTPYSKEGPEGGLLCGKCSKEVADANKKQKKQDAKALNRGKRRKLQSDLLDGLAAPGARSLLDLCIKVQ